MTLVVAIGAFAAFALPSFANLSGSTFEGNDGNLVVNTSGNTDWCTDFPYVAGTTCSSPEPGLNVGLDNPSGSTDNAFGQGTKEDDPNVTVVDGSIPPNKSDLIRFYEASEVVSNNVYLYLAWERTNVLGSANMDFEINQNATTGFSGSTVGPITLNRTNGDVLVTFDFGGSGAPVLGILRWLVAGQQNPDQTHFPGLNTASECFSANTLPCWGDHLTLNSTNSEGAVNSTTVTDPIAPNAPRSLAANTFGEAAINLTGAGVITSSNGCAFGSATTFLKSRSSASFKAEIKDFVAPVSTPVLNNCGAIKITKTSTKGTALAGATFSINGPNSYSNSVTTGDDGTVCVGNLTFGTYMVQETAAPAGYSIDDTTSHSVNVNVAGSCPSPPAGTSLAFTDTPLTDISASATSEAVGGTESTITCLDGSSNNVGNSPQGPAASPTVSATALPPGTYTCTIVIDP